MCVCGSGWVGVVGLVCACVCVCVRLLLRGRYLDVVDLQPTLDRRAGVKLEADDLRT